MLSFGRAPRRSKDTYPTATPENPFAAPASAENPFAAPAAATAREEPVVPAFTEPAWARASNSSRSSFDGAPAPAAPRISIASGFSIFGSDPDRAHDKKLAGVAINPSVTAMKASLRRLRTTVESVASFYAKYADKKPATCALVLPEMAEWPRNELFCGSQASSEQLHLEAARLAAIEELMVAERAAISSEVAAKLREGARMVVESLEGLYAFELQLRDVSQALEAAAKALKRGQAAQEAAAADERKASALKDDKKRVAAEAAAQKAHAKATDDIAEARAAIASGEAEQERLVRETQPAALDAARAGRRAAEAGPIGGAAAALAHAYREFALGSGSILRGEQPAAAEYNPSVKRKAPRETSARFAAYVVQWTLAKRRCKSSAALLDEFVKARLETALAPAKEGPTLDTLAAECQQADVVRRIEAARRPEAELANACAACRTAAGTLGEALGACRVLLKAQVAAAEEYEKRDKALRALRAKRDEVEREVAKLEGQLESHPAGSKVEMTLSRRRIDLQAMTEECDRRAAALEAAAAELEGFASDLAADEGERSVAVLVGQPLRAFVAQYGTFCATRGRDASGADGGSANDDHADAEQPVPPPQPVPAPQAPSWAGTAESALPTQPPPVWASGSVGESTPAPIWASGGASEAPTEPAWASAAAGEPAPPVPARDPWAGEALYPAIEEDVHGHAHAPHSQTEADVAGDGETARACSAPTLEQASSDDVNPFVTDAVQVVEAEPANPFVADAVQVVEAEPANPFVANAVQVVEAEPANPFVADAAQVVEAEPAPLHPPAAGTDAFVTRGGHEEETGLPLVTPRHRTTQETGQASAVADGDALNPFG